MAGIAVVEIVAAVAVAVLAALGGVVAEGSFPAYFSAAKTRLASVDNYIVHSEGGALVFVVEEVASEFVTEVEVGLELGPGHEPEPGAMTYDSVTAEVEAVVFVVEDEFVTEAEIGLGLGHEPEPGAMADDSVTAEIEAVVFVAEAEVFG